MLHLLQLSQRTVPKLCMFAHLRLLGLFIQRIKQRNMIFLWLYRFGRQTGYCTQQCPVPALFQLLQGLFGSPVACHVFAGVFQAYP